MKFLADENLYEPVITYSPKSCSHNTRESENKENGRSVIILSPVFI